MRLSNQHHTITATVETKPMLEGFDFVYNPANTSLYEVIKIQGTLALVDGLE